MTDTEILECPECHAENFVILNFLNEYDDVTCSECKYVSQIRSKRCFYLERIEE